MNLQQILTRRGELKDAIAAIETEHADPAVPIPDDVQQRVAAYEAEAARLNDSERRMALFADRAMTAPGKPLSSAAQPELRVFDGMLSPRPEAFDGEVWRTQSGERVPLLESRHRLSHFLAPEQRSEIGIAEFLRAMYFGPRNEIERRVLAESSVGSGGAMVPAPLSAQVIDALVAQSVSFRAGASMIPMSALTQAFARVTTLPTGTFRAENSPIHEDQPAFDRVTLTAHTWALLVRCSRELFEDGINTSPTIVHTIGQAGALATDSAIMFGPGGANAPTGIANTPGVQTIPAGGALDDWTLVLDAVAALEGANVADPTAIVYAPRTGRAIAGLVDTLGQPLRMPPKIEGIPQYSTTTVPVNGGTGTNESTIFVGDWRTVLVGMRTQLQVSQLLERYADQGQIGFVAWLRMDVALAHPQAMAMITGVTPSTTTTTTTRQAPSAGTRKP